MLRVDGSKARVLVIHPSAHMRRLIVTLMAALGIKSCEEARSVVQAVPLVLKTPPDLIVIDLGGDSTEALLFAHRLRRGEFGQTDTSILGISPSTHHAILEVAWEAGINDMVSTPISAIEIIQRAGALIEESHRRKPVGRPRSAAE
ncbi:MAG: response [Rhodospirillaceae bacterium]|nr:MAG: response [Rhodospirillaceae bacterium]TNC95928.1 MAG: response regulator [Stygiobacter sp.]